MLVGDVLLLGVAERPDLVALDDLARQIAQGVVLVVRARFPEIDQQLDDRVFRRAGHAHRAADRHALDQAADDLRPLLSRQPVHTDHYA
jgi:hypothetical protein